MVCHLTHGGKKLKKLAIVGCGSRGYFTFAKGLKEDYADKVDIVGVCDTNIKRCEFYRDTINPDMKIYEAKDFETMIDETRPDIVLVATIDCFHHEYIVRAMRKGCDVFCEKPVTIDQEKCKIIRDAVRQTGRKLTVTFNVRFQPYFAKLKEIIASGEIGRPLSINYNYMLNTTHGGDYWKRWHRFMDKSGGMLLHKSTHHFDVVNWLLEDEPVSVSAQGARLYYGNDDIEHGERCSTCPHTKTCYSYCGEKDVEGMKELYVNAEHVDGYERDHCSFKSDTDIYDTMSVSVSYKKGALLTYGINFYSTHEGFTMDIVGEKGRIQASSFFADNTIIVHKRGGEEIKYHAETVSGGHNGADTKMFEMLFGDVKEDPLNQRADTFEGFKSVMIGIGANQSIKEGKRIDLTHILNELR